MGSGFGSAFFFWRVPLDHRFRAAFRVVWVCCWLGWWGWGWLCCWLRSSIVVDMLGHGPGDLVVPLSLALEYCDEDVHGHFYAAAVPFSAAVPDDALGRLAAWADENDAAVSIQRVPKLGWFGGYAYDGKREEVGGIKSPVCPWLDSPGAVAAVLLAALADTPEARDV